MYIKSVDAVNTIQTVYPVLDKVLYTGYNSNSIH